METIRLVPSTYQLSNTSYLKITNPGNIYTNTDSTTYATVTNSQTGTTSYYLYIRGFNFDSIPDNAIVSSFTVKIKANESGGSTSTSYRPYLCNGSTALTNAYSNVINTTTQVLTFSCSATWETIKGYGANFGIRINCRRNSRNTQATFNIYGAEILVEYTVPVPYDVTTSGSGCTVRPSGTTTVYGGDSFVLTIDADSKPIVTDNNIDVTSKLVEKTASLDYSVNTAQGASYGFDVNSNGYYESKNKAKATTAAVCIVSMDLPVSCTVTFSLINYAESTYDYGLLGNIDKTLTNSASADTSNVYWNGKNNNSSSVQTVTYTVPSGEHFIYVKYFKDSYTDSNNDTLQFKVAIEPNEAYTAATYYEYKIESVNENHTIVATVSESGEQLLLKVDGSWRNVLKVYKKIDGKWVEQHNISEAFDESVNYVKSS